MVFNAYDVFEMAVNLERSGFEFYSKAAESLGPEEREAKELLLRLAAAECEHEGSFDSLKSAYKLTPETGYPDLDADYADYLRSLVKTTIFNDRSAAKLLAGSPSPESVLETALTLERSSVVFFASIKDSVPESLDKSRVDSIIREEIRHIAALFSLLEKRKGEH